MIDKKSKGYILIITILAIGALFFFAFLLVRLQASERKIATKGENDLIAEQAAKAGIDDALYQLKQDISWNSGFNKKALPNSNAIYSMSFDNTQTTIPYSTNNSSGAATVTGYRDRKVPPGMIHLISIGKSVNSSKIEESLISKSGGTLFEGALFGANEVKLNGGIKIDSYNSNNGNYDENNAGTSGNVGSNLNGSDPIELKGQVEVNGSIILPSGTDENDGINSSNKSTYLSFQNESIRNLEIIESPINMGPNKGDVKVKGGTVLLSPGVYSKLEVSGNATIQFLPGDYIFTDDIDISGQSNVVVQNDLVRIFAQGEDISITGGSTINKDGKPGNLLFFGGAKTESIKIAGGSQIYLGIYAPASEVKVTGSADLYGGIVGKEINFGGTVGIHYDESMKIITGGSGVLTVKVRW